MHLFHNWELEPLYYGNDESLKKLWKKYFIRKCTKCNKVQFSNRPLDDIWLNESDSDKKYREGLK